MARAIDAEKYMELLKKQYLHNKSMGNSQAARAWQGAMQLLYDMPTLTPPNESLMLDELRQMDGEPVWFDTIKRWGIVKVNREGIFVVTKSGEYEFGRCKVYRRPPEGEANA